MKGERGTSLKTGCNPRCRGGQPGVPVSQISTHLVTGCAIQHAARILADQIVITEKSSQAKDVRAAVGSRYGEILPAEGHLFDLLEPEDVVPEWKRWSPILCCGPMAFTALARRRAAI